MFRIKLDSSSPIALYRQVIREIKLEILTGRLQQGSRLPPIRELAKLLQINPNTVAKAYDNLESEGFLTSRRGSGHWINAKSGELDGLRSAMLEDEFRSFLERALALGASRKKIKDMMTRHLDHE